MGDYYAYAGTFTTPARGARGTGIHAFRIDRGSGRWQAIQHLPGLVNPSFLIVAPGLQRLFAVHGDADYASAYALDSRTGRAAPLGQAATGGLNGVALSLDPAMRFLLVANYASGTVATLPVAADGSLRTARHVLPLTGTPGPDPKEQASSHPHDIRFEPAGRRVLVPDKGLDQVFVLDFDPISGQLTPAWSIPARSGAGPRHAAFHPGGRTLWILNELDSTIATHRWTGTALTAPPAQILSTRPDGAATPSAAAEIAVSVSGRFVYCSNRGDDSIATFGVERGGVLRPLGWHPSGGRTPRFIALDPDGRRLYAANEATDTIAAFPLDPVDGLPGAAAPAIPIGSPAAIAFFDPEGPPGRA